MNSISKTRAAFYHLYPGIIITIVFVFLTPAVVHRGYPPQMGALLAIVIAALPLFILHLRSARRRENRTGILQLNLFTNRLPGWKLAAYVAGLVVLSFAIWTATEPLNRVITEKFLGFLPDWFTVQDFAGYSKTVILQTLFVNLLVNGVLAPLVEEYYFRGYLLARMQTWGRSAFLVNGILFSLYHFWQPQIWLTLILAMTPLAWVTWKTRDLRVAIYTHCLLNLLGALAAFGLATRS